MSAALRRLGVEVTTELDADRVELTEALRAFTRRSAGADVSLVFYAGHGIEMDGVNYLVPVDARLERDVDVRFETVTVDDLLVSTTGASLRLVILDACRNNPLARSMQRTAATRTVSGGSFADLNEDLLGDETLVAYAAAAGTTAADGRGRNSPYTAALLSHPGRLRLASCIGEVAGLPRTTRRESGGTGVRPNRATPARRTTSASVTGPAAGWTRTTRKRPGGSAVRPSRDMSVDRPTSAGCTETVAASSGMMRKPLAGTGERPTRATQGDAVGQAGLGIMYESGRGVQRDRVEAVRWYQLAAEQGNATGQAGLERLRCEFRVLHGVSRSQAGRAGN